MNAEMFMFGFILHVCNDTHVVDPREKADCTAHRKHPHSPNRREWNFLGGGGGGVSVGEVHV